jgi:hypothetical protein
VIARAKAIAILVIILAVMVRVLWWSLQPLLPLAIVAIGLLFVYSAIFRRKW